MITVSAFKNTSSELVVSSMHFPKVILPNDKDIDLNNRLYEWKSKKNLNYDIYICINMQYIDNTITKQYIA